MDDKILDNYKFPGSKMMEFKCPKCSGLREERVWKNSRLDIISKHKCPQCFAKENHKGIIEYFTEQFSKRGIPFSEESMAKVLDEEFHFLNMDSEKVGRFYQYLVTGKIPEKPNKEKQITEFEGNSVTVQQEKKGKENK